MKNNKIRPGLLGRPVSQFCYHFGIYRCKRGLPLTIREELELREKEILAPWAAFSAQSRGRLVPEEQCDIRPVFQRDRDRILHSKSFRRLKDKTQVFLSPDGDHYRTRMTHTLEVSQNARTIAKALRLNEDLAEARSLQNEDDSYSGGVAERKDYCQSAAPQ